MNRLIDELRLATSTVHAKLAPATAAQLQAFLLRTPRHMTSRAVTPVAVVRSDEVATTAGGGPLAAAFDVCLPTTVTADVAAWVHRFLQTATALRSARGPPPRPFRVLFAVDAGSLATDAASAALCRTLRTIISFTEQCAADGSLSAPLALSAVVVAVRGAWDAPRVEALLGGLQHHLALRRFDVAATDIVFAALLYEMIPLCPVLLSAPALARLRSSWNAAHRVQDVIWCLHSLVATCGRDANGNVCVSVLFTPAVDRVIGVCLDAAAGLAGDAAYPARARAFAQHYEAFCDGNLRLLRGDHRRSLEQLLEAEGPQLVAVALDGHLPRSIPSAATELFATLDPAAAIGLPQGPTDTAALGDPAATAPLLLASGDATRVLHCLRYFGSKRRGGVAVAEVARCSGGLSEDRLVRALADLRSRRLIAVNVAKQTVRAVTDL